MCVCMCGLIPKLCEYDISSVTNLFGLITRVGLTVPVLSGSWKIEILITYQMMLK